MKKICKRFLSLLLVAVMLVGMLPTIAIQADADTAFTPDIAGVSGTCGSGLTWELTGDGVLTISGKGAMENYPYYGSSKSDAPWFPYKDSIKKIVIGNGVTAIGEFAFLGLAEAESVDFGSGVTTVGAGAFFCAKSLNNVVIPDNITFMDYSIFNGCSSLTNVTIGKGLTEITFSTFENCSGLTEVTIPDNITAIGSSAFASCPALTKVVMGKGVREIDYNAFEFADNLKEVYFSGNAPDVKESWAFPYDAEITFYYTPGTTGWTDSEAYDAETGMWYRFKLLPWEEVTEIASGYCGGEGDGKNLSWVLGTDGTLTISGSGEMGNWDSWDVPWFKYYQMFSNVVIADEVTSIGSNAFYDCDSLETISLPNHVASIGDYVFYDCDSLTEVTIPGSVETIENNAFEECSALETVTIGDGTVNIGNYAFFNCDSLTEVTIPGSVETIEDNAFEECSALETVTIGDGVVNIGNYAFYNCDSLTEVTIPGSVKNMGVGVFEECSGLTKATLGNGMETTGYWTFKNCESLTELNLPESLAAIGNYAIENCDSLKTIKLPNSLVSIGYQAFLDSDGLTEVTISGSVETIEGHAFEECSGLETVTIGDGVVNIGNSAFYNCDSLTEVTFGSGLEYIGTCAFYDCDSLWEVTIPDNVVGMGTNVFESCDSLTKATIGNGLIYLEGWTFKDCGNLAELNLPQGIEVLGDYALENCSSLKSVTIPDSVITIGTGTFCECSGLMEVALPDGLFYIGNRAFQNCSGLKEVVIPDSVVTIGTEAFLGSFNLTRVSMGNGVISIGSSAFYGSGVVDLTIGSKVEVIDARAFEECNSLETVTIPASVTEIKNWAFRDGDKLTAVYFEGNAPSVAPADSYYHSFDTSVTLYYTSGTDGWTNSEFYDAEAGTWNGYKLAVWKEAVAEDVALPKITLEEIFGAFGTAQKVPITLVAMDNVAVVSLKVEYANQNGEKQMLQSWMDKIPGERLEGSMEWDVTKLPEGDYELFATAEDTSGNIATIFLGYITVDHTAPTILDVWPKDKVALCHDTTMQILAEDNDLLTKAKVSFHLAGKELYSTTVEAIKPTQETRLDIPVDLTELPGGTYEVHYTVYDRAGNSAETTTVVLVHPYKAPEKPVVTAEAGYKTAALTWTYGGDLNTMDQFVVYACDENGENRSYVTAGKKFKQNLTIPKDGMQYFCVEARDIYGGTTCSDVVAVQSVQKETEPPKAVILPKDLTGTTGSAVTFSGASSTDNDVIVSYEWDFGDGSTGSGKLCDHTYTAAGSYKVKLTVTDESGNRNTKTETIHIYDISGENATHAQLTVTVRDAYKNGNPVLPNANVVVTTTDRSFETAGVTDAKGTVSLVVPLGNAVVTVAADGYVARSKDINVEADASGNASVEMGMTPMDVSVVDGSLTVREMTYEEIVEAGIDVTAPENQHVFEFEIVLEFKVAMDIVVERPVSGYVTNSGKIYPDRSSWGFIDTDDSGPTPDPGPSVDVEQLVKSLQIGVFPVAENIYLVIYGQAHWLKEMFNVELLVANNSYMYDITDCTAKLELPEGLSLAAMTGEAQTETIDLGTIGKQNSSIPSMKKANWYICGDDVGEYYLSAEVNGLLDGEAFSASFETDQPVKVFAGEALHLYIEADKYAAKGLMYPVQFELKNVSTKELYNVQLEVLGAEFQKGYSIDEIHYKGGNEGWQWKDGAILSAQVLKPGESLTGEFQIRFAEDLAEEETRYMLTNNVARTLSGSTTEVPVTITTRDNLFRYTSNYGEKRDAEGTFFYDDDFFRQSATVFNPELAYMTLCLASAGYNSSDVFRRGYSAEVAGQNIRDLLTKVGFEEDKIQQKSAGASYEGRPDDDTIAVSLASRPYEDKGEDYTLLAVVVRGGNYEFEWHDNFIVGTAEEHEGFSKAATKVMKALNQYIADQNITGKVKVWITGYSRGSATANLVAARIMDGEISNAVTCTKENLYAYGFATPMGTTSKNAHASKYSTIYSIVSPADFVPMVAPEEWDYDRYGKTYYLPSPGVSQSYDKYNELLKNAYAYTTGNVYQMDKFRTWNLAISPDSLEMVISMVENNSLFMQEAFLQEFSQILFGQSIKSAELYTTKYQEAISDLIGIIAGSPEEASALGDTLVEVISMKLPIYVGMYIKGGKMTIPAIIAGLSGDLAKALSLYSFQSEHMNLDETTALNLVLKLEGIILEALILYPNYGLTMLLNGKYVGMAHYQEHYLSWMRLIQSETQFNESVWSEILDDERGYRKVCVKCPVDVEVYDVSGGTPVLKAKIVDKDVQVVEGSSMIAYVDENGQMIFHLPYNGEYEVKITATDDGEVTYSVTEVNLVTGEETKHAYYGVAVSEGDVLTGFANNLTDAQPDAYTLTGGNGAVIAPSEILEGDEIVTHTVNVTVDGDGATMGGGNVDHGDFVKVVAYATGEQNFVGWFEGETLLSEDAEYTTYVRNDLELTAKFADPGEVELSVEENTALVQIRTNDPGTAVFAIYDTNGKFVKCELREVETGETEWTPDVTGVDLSGSKLKVFLLRGKDSKKPWTAMCPVAQYPVK